MRENRPRTVVSITLTMLTLSGVAVAAISLSAAAAWVSENPMPYGHYFTKAAVSDSHVYDFGGMGDYGLCGTRDISIAPLNPDGTVGTWSVSGRMPHDPNSTHTVTKTCAGTQFDLDSRIIGWGYEAIQANGYLYILGGNRWDFDDQVNGGQAISFSSQTFVAKLNSDGSIGAWSQGPYLPGGAAFIAAAVVNGTLYVTGGRADAATVVTQSSVYSSKINADGSLAPWQSQPSMPRPLWGHAAAATGSRLYVSGGANSDPDLGEVKTNAVASAQINPDGSLGVWRDESTLPVEMWLHGMVNRHDILNAIGGEGPSGVMIDVLISTPGADGALPSWTLTDPLKYITREGLTVSKGNIYSLGGQDLSGGPFFADVWRLPDSIAPGSVSDLTAEAIDGSSLRVNWTATGNDEVYGAVPQGQFDIRYSLTASDFSSFESIPGVVTLSSGYAPGDPRTAAISGLSPGTTYYLAMKSVDDAGNRSALSNVVSVMTFYRAVSSEPVPALTLDSPYPSFTITIVSQQDAALALQSAPGALLSSIYEISPSGTPLSPSGILTIRFDPALNPTDVAIYKYVSSAVGWSSAPITSQTVDLAGHSVTGRLSSTSMYALFARAPAGSPPPPSGSKSFSLAVSPSTLNLKSQGQKITAVLQPVSGAAANQINRGSLAIAAVDGNAVTPLYPISSKLGDSNGDGISDVLLTFDRSAVQSVLTPGDRSITVSGRLLDGSALTATGSVRVINPGATSDPGPVSSGPPASNPGHAHLVTYKRIDPAQVSMALHGVGIVTTGYINVPVVGKGKKPVVKIPEGAASSGFVATVSTQAAEEAPDRETRRITAEHKHLAEASPAVEFGPTGTRFETPVTLELPYDPGTLKDGDESRLAVHYWNPATRDWEKLDSIVDRVAHVVRAQTRHFSTYQVLVGVAAAADLYFNDAYSYPSPSRHGQPVTLRIQPGPATTVEFNVYDASGRKVHSSNDFVYRPAFDDGNGKGALDTYDHVWDVSGAASGVYTWAITARKAGQGDVRKTGKVAVIK